MTLLVKTAGFEFSALELVRAAQEVLSTRTAAFGAVAGDDDAADVAGGTRFD